MSAPNPKAVVAALCDLDAAHRCIGRHTLAPDTLRTLEAAARAYLRAPTAPQGAEIARVPREPTQAMASAASAYANARYDWTFAGVWRAMYDAALTPIDAETKKP